MTRDQAIAEAKRMFECKGTLEIPATPATWENGNHRQAGTWVEARVFVPKPKLTCGASMPGLCPHAPWLCRCCFWAKEAKTDG